MRGETLVVDLQSLTVIKPVPTLKPLVPGHVVDTPSRLYDDLTQVVGNHPAAVTGQALPCPRGANVHRGSDGV
jgi:hypothetical protein